MASARFSRRGEAAGDRPERGRPPAVPAGRGIVVLVAFLVTSAVGGPLTFESSYLPPALASHICLAIVPVGIAG